MSTTVLATERASPKTMPGRPAPPVSDPDQRCRAAVATRLRPRAPGTATAADRQQFLRRGIAGRRRTSGGSRRPRRTGRRAARWRRTRAYSGPRRPPRTGSRRWARARAGSSRTRKRAPAARPPVRVRMRSRSCMSRVGGFAWATRRSNVSPWDACEDEVDSESSLCGVGPRPRRLGATRHEYHNHRWQERGRPKPAFPLPGRASTPIA